jgi:hypothetical protein
VTPEELRRLQTAKRAAFRRYETTRKARNAAIRQAAGERMPHVAIAAATELTRSRVGQLASGPAVADEATPAPVTTDQLRGLAAAARAALARYEKAREASNAAVRQAAAGSATHAQIAAATGISRSRAGKIAGRLGRDVTAASSDDIGAPTPCG